MAYEPDDNHEVNGYDDEDDADPGYDGVKGRHDIPPVYWLCIVVTGVTVMV